MPSRADPASRTGTVIIRISTPLEVPEAISAPSFPFLSFIQRAIDRPAVRFVDRPTRSLEVRPFLEQDPCPDLLTNFQGRVLRAGHDDPRVHRPCDRGHAPPSVQETNRADS